MKYSMTVFYPKTGHCSIYPEKKETKTDWHHILGRPTQALTNDRYGIIELGDYAHAYKDEEDTKSKIYMYQIQHFPDWIKWYLEHYKSPKGVVYDPKGYYIVNLIMWTLNTVFPF